MNFLYFLFGLQVGIYISLFVERLVGETIEEMGGKTFVKTGWNTYQEVLPTKLKKSDMLVPKEENP